MEVLPLLSTLPQVASSIAADDYSITMLGLLIGSIAGSVICGYMQQARARKADLERRQNPYKRTQR
jgi:hypothetical protein